MASNPYGYNEMSSVVQKEYEAKVSLILYPFIKEKKESFTDSEIKFLACWLYYFSTKEVDSREWSHKEYSSSNLNYEILNHFRDLGLIQQSRKGVYKLNDKVQAVLDIIERHVPNLDSYISKSNKEPNIVNEGKEVSDNE